MCMFCGGQCGGIGNVLAPFIGLTAAMFIIKIETKIKAWWHKRKNQDHKCPIVSKNI